MFNFIIYGLPTAQSFDISDRLPSEPETMAERAAKPVPAGYTCKLCDKAGAHWMIDCSKFVKKKQPQKRKSSSAKAAAAEAAEAAAGRGDDDEEEGPGGGDLAAAGDAAGAPEAEDAGDGTYGEQAAIFAALAAKKAKRPKVGPMMEDPQKHRSVLFALQSQLRFAL